MSEPTSEPPETLDEMYRGLRGWTGSFAMMWLGKIFYFAMALSLTAVPPSFAWAELPDKTSIFLQRAPLAAAAYANLLSARRTPCLMQELYRQSKKGKPAAKQPEHDIVSGLMSSQERKCAVFTLMEKVVRPFIVRLMRTGTAKNYHFFVQLDPAERMDQWVSKEIGVFPTLTVCQRFERALHNLNVPTQKCEMRTTTPPRPIAPRGK